MVLKQLILATLIFSLLSTDALAGKPQNYLYTSSDELDQLRPLLERQNIDGVQVVYAILSLTRHKISRRFSCSS
ncbi:hypothetical protein [Photorhabdus sp. RW14-46]|uniref:hypothetical protein n=1 Tax=Photorhabdus sp. RW14-46 TaxID=2100168 RepID=UPI0030D9E89F